MKQKGAPREIYDDEEKQAINEKWEREEKRIKEKHRMSYQQLF